MQRQGFVFWVAALGTRQGGDHDHQQGGPLMGDYLTVQFTDELVVLTCWCGINHAVPRNLRDFQMRQHNDGERVTSIYCPLGHTHAPAGKGEAAKLREKLERAEARETRLRAEADQLEASLRATRGHLTR